MREALLIGLVTLLYACGVDQGALEGDQGVAAERSSPTLEGDVDDAVETLDAEELEPRSDAYVPGSQGGIHPPPPHTRPPPPPPPEEFGAGFTRLELGLESPPWPLFGGDDNDIPSPTSALFGDLDGDGFSELVISSGRKGLPGASSDMDTLTSKIFRYDPLSASLKEAPGLPLPIGHILAIADLDGDGRDDLLTLGPSTVHWGGEPIGQSLMLEQAGGSELLHWKALSLADIDRDGLLDLVGQPVSCCSITCPELALVFQEGRREFRARSELIETVNHANVCASLVAPLGGERLLMSFAAVSTCGGRSHLFYRELGEDLLGMPTFEAFDALGESATLQLALSSPMGASVADVDRDGDLDLTMTTDPYHVMLRAEDDWPLTDVTTWTGIGLDGLILPPDPLGPERYMIPWGAAFIDLDQDGRDDVIYSHGADPNPGGAKVELDVGPQHITAHWNGGDMHFVDVTHALGLKRLGEWRALTLGDMDADGDADIGVGGLGEFPQVYRNDISTSGRGFALRLRGTTSNVLGLGALVRVWPKEASAAQLYLMGHIGNPYGLSQPLIFVGLGDEEVAHDVEIQWPSGFVQRVQGLESGRLHTITEPATIMLSPWSRRLAHAEGKSAFVEVKARYPDGSVRTDVDLSLSITHGEGLILGEGVPHEGGMRWEVGPPDAPGQVRLEARVGGEPLSVRPRLFWH